MPAAPVWAPRGWGAGSSYGLRTGGWGQARAPGHFGSAKNMAVLAEVALPAPVMPVKPA